jgi:hypothetical protein
MTVERAAGTLQDRAVRLLAAPVVERERPVVESVAQGPEAVRTPQVRAAQLLAVQEPLAPE